MLSWMEGDPVFVTIILLGMLVIAYGVGLAIGWRRPKDSHNPSGARITDASLALMGLLLGFSFAMAISKYDHRRETVVNLSNAIGDFTTCVQVLDDSPQRDQLLKLLKEYVQYRLTLGNANIADEKEWQTAMDRISGMHDRMTQLVREIIHKGTRIDVPLVNTLNEITSAHAARAVALRDRLPASIVALLFLAMSFSLALLGWQQGAAGGRFHISTFLLLILVIAALYNTLDLNQPQRGLIRVSREPLEWLLKSMGPG
jgi:CHASE3 domain sensor protein